MKNHKVAIIDYGMGNLFSVASACQKVDLEPIITREKTIIKNCSAIILPGVGAYNEAMSRLNQYDLIDTILNFINSGKQLFGICLGMQLLFSRSNEFGNTSGLGVIQGTVNKLDGVLGERFLKIPHIGWNKIIKKNIEWNTSYFDGIKENTRMYFVHSYFVKPEKENTILSLTSYGQNTFCSAILLDNIFATQFHPEKSGEVGLRIYSNFKSKL